MSIVRINNPRSHQFKYDVAFSFAEEDRAFVDQVAALLKPQKVKVYYYPHEQTDSWGKSLSVHLDEVYRTEARFCVMFVSRYYKTKRWTAYEFKVAEARAFFMQNKEYILPFRFDDSEIPGLQDSIAYLSRELYDEKQLAQAIVDKVKRTKPSGPFSGKQRYAAILLLLMLSVVDISVYQLSGRSTITARLLQELGLRNKWHFSAVCKDGTLSQTRNSGACSHHDGVEYRIDTVLYGENLGVLKRTLIHVKDK